MTHVCLFVEKPLGNFDRDRFCFVFKAQLSGAKFYAMRSFTRKGDVSSFDKRQSKDPFTRMAEVAELSCCTASSSGNFTLLKHTKACKKFASSTLPTETGPRCASTVTLQYSMAPQGNHRSSGNGADSIACRVDSSAQQSAETAGKDECRDTPIPRIAGSRSP